jgi:hypothetical protein
MGGGGEGDAKLWPSRFASDAPARRRQHEHVEHAIVEDATTAEVRGDDVVGVEEHDAT